MVAATEGAHVVRTLSDLPEPVGGEITLTADAPWIFLELVSIGLSTLVIPDNAEVFAGSRSGGVQGSADPLVRVGAFDRYGPFLVSQLAVGAVAVYCTGNLNVFHDWRVFGTFSWFAGGGLYLYGGHYTDLQIAAGNPVQVLSPKLGRARIIGEVVGTMLFQGIQQVGADGPLVEVVDGVRLPNQLTIANSFNGTAVPLLSLGNAVNSAGALGGVRVVGCSTGAAGGITAAALPGGGLTVEACTLAPSPNSFVGFTEATAGVFVRACFDTGGAKLTETALA
jgi:hypothetical protein